MCLSVDAETLLKQIDAEAEAQTRDDKSPSGKRKVRPDTKVEYRLKASMCIAYCLLDGCFYVGFSGDAGGMSKGKDVLHTSLGTSRRNHLRDMIADTAADEKESKGVKRKFSATRVGPANYCFCNCGEACAAALAKSWNEKCGAEHLVFVSYCDVSSSTGTREKKALCKNCQIWVATLAAGYWDPKAGGIVTKCSKWNRDRDDPGPGSGSVSSSDTNGGKTEVPGY